MKKQHDFGCWLGGGHGWHIWGREVRKGFLSRVNISESAFRQSQTL